MSKSDDILSQLWWGYIISKFWWLILIVIILAIVTYPEMNKEYDVVELTSYLDISRFYEI